MREFLLGVIWVATLVAISGALLGWWWWCLIPVAVVLVATVVLRREW